MTELHLYNVRQGIEGAKENTGEAAEHHSGDFNKGTCSRSVIF